MIGLLITVERVVLNYLCSCVICLYLHIYPHTATVYVFTGKHLPRKIFSIKYKFIFVKTHLDCIYARNAFSKFLKEMYYRIFDGFVLLFV